MKYLNNLTLSGGGNKKPGLAKNHIFSMHRMTKSKTANNSLFNLSYIENVFSSCDLWIEIPSIPKPIIIGEKEFFENWRNFIYNLIVFLNAFKTQTIVLRFNQGTTDYGTWPEQDGDMGSYYTDWIERWPLYDPDDKKPYTIAYLLKSCPTIKNIWFLPWASSIDDWWDGIYFLNNYCLTTDNSKMNNLYKKYNTGVCIEVEALVSDESTAYVGDIDNSNAVAKKISYLIEYNVKKNGLHGTIADIQSFFSNFTNKSGNKIAATGPPTQGKSINRIVDVNKNIFIKTYFGQWYNLDGFAPNYKSNPNDIVDEYKTKVKLVDTVMENYWPMISIETNKIRHLDGETGSYSSKKIKMQLGDNTWKNLSTIVSLLKQNYNTKNIMIYSGGFIEQIENPNTDLEKAIQPIPSITLSLIS
jgi:hypothetical protein